MTKSDDAALHERWLTLKDGDAFAELARRHAPVVFDLAARALGDRTAAEDVVQEALLDLALEPTRKPAEVGVVAWLARFAICRARNQRSSERCRARRQQIVGLRRPEESMPDEHLEQKEELEHALASAEPEERAVLAMRFLHGWDYDRIAAALETSEGAARVRVHRALSNVRNRLGAGGTEDSAVARRMAGIAIIPLSAAKLDGVIRGALDAAGVPFGTAGASRLPAALRSGLQAFGVALLVASAAVSSTSLLTDGPRAGSSAGEGTELAAAADAQDAFAPARGVAGSSGGAAAFVVPRPAAWDGGALARLARGESEIGDVDAARPARAEPKSAAPAAPDLLAALPPAAAPAAAAERQPSAFRPSARGASAANCDPGSSDDERADALGGFARTAAPEPAAERPQADAPAVADEPAAVVETAPRRRVVSHGRAFEVLDESEQALVEQAAALVRDVVAKSDPDTVRDADPKSGSHARTTRAVKRHVRELRRLAASASPTPGRAAHRQARVSRLVSLLVQYALAENAASGGVRWPDGVDVTSALQDLIRVLSTASAQRPDIAADEATDPGEPQVAQDAAGARPDLE